MRVDRPDSLATNLRPGQPDSARETFLPSNPKLSQGVVSHVLVAKGYDIELSEVWVLRGDTGANLQVDERCRDAVLVNIDPSAP